MGRPMAECGNENVPPVFPGEVSVKPVRQWIYQGSRRKERASLLDILDRDCSLGRAGYQGWSRLCAVMVVLWMLKTYATAAFERDYIVDLSMYNNMRIPIIPTLALWSFQLVWSFHPLFIVRYLLYPNCVPGGGCKGILSPRYAILAGRVLQHLCQCFLFLVTVLFIYSHDLRAEATLFAIMTCAIFFMKAHSYLQTNKEFLRRFEAAAKADTRFSLSKRYEPNEEARELLTFTGTGRLVTEYVPRNLRMSDMAHYILTPSLVYEPDLPCVPRRYFDAVRRALIIGLTLSFLYAYLTEICKPIVLRFAAGMTFFEGLVRLLIPSFVCALTLFFFLFEGVCNLLADLTGVADRHFYDTWFEATTFEEFNKRWNRPVYEFLLRHFFLELTIRKKWNRYNSMLATIGFSALLHELIMAVIIRDISPLFFIMMVLQVPLFIIQNATMRGSRFGNIVFWAGVMIGWDVLVTHYAQIYVHSMIT